MFDTYFYHERIRRSIGAFGSLFNNLYILRKKSPTKGSSQIRVPLSFAPKRKWMERLDEISKNELADAHVVAITLPRMSFEVTGINYDPRRQLPRTNFQTFKGSSTDKKTKIYTKTPYNIQFQLNVYGKTHDDALQIVEQIIPYFTPSYTLTVRPLDDFPEITDDIPLTINGISFSDDYEGGMEQRRTIVYTLDFEMKIDFYGPITTGSIIRQADVTTFLSGDSTEYPGWSPYSLLSVTTDPADVSPDSDFTFIENLFIIGEGDSV